MPVFDTSHVKNIVLLGHNGSGKITLAEYIFYELALLNYKKKLEEYSKQ